MAVMQHNRCRSCVNDNMANVVHPDYIHTMPCPKLHLASLHFHDVMPIWLSGRSLQQTSPRIVAAKGLLASTFLKVTSKMTLWSCELYGLSLVLRRSVSFKGCDVQRGANPPSQVISSWTWSNEEREGDTPTHTHRNNSHISQCDIIYVRGRNNTQHVVQRPL